MKLPKGSLIAVTVALAWTVCALGSIALREVAGAVLLFWLPSAIASAALFAARKEQRLPVLAGVVLGNLTFNALVGLSLNMVESIGYTVANVVEPLIVVAIVRRVLGHRGLNSVQLRHLVMLLLGVLAGTIVSAIIALPFRPQADLVRFAWWILANTLAITVAGPILLCIHHWLQRLRAREIGFFSSIPWAYIATMVSLFALSWVVLSTFKIPLGPLILAGLVLSVVRFGQLGASGTVFVFGAAGTLHSVGGLSPGVVTDLDPFVAGIVLQSYMLLMLATSLPLAGLLIRHDRLALRLKSRNARMREHLLMLNMAEDVARIGRWRYDPRTGEQDWSRQMLLINGLDPSLGSDPGDVRKLLPDGGRELFGQLSHHAKDRARYSIEYRINPPHGDERILKMHATNEFTEDGELASMFGVVIDVTEHHQRQEALDRERTRAMRLAAEAQYLAHTDPLTGLANRRRTITQLEKCIRRSQQGGSPLAMISFDIDHFKRINDSNGHQIGDDVLVRVAEISRSQARASDLVGRMGGEEFIWILPDAGPSEARNAAERLRHAIEHESSEGGLPPVTASIGYAMWREGDDANALLARVDDALYAAKDAGRNKVQKAA